jgi:hypothetical protein
MAKRRFALSTKASPHPAPHSEPGSQAPDERTGISKGCRGPSRFRYRARVDDPRGWRSSFMGF